MTQAFSFFPHRVARMCMIVAALAGCDAVLQTPTQDQPEPGVFAATKDGPDNAPPGTCWGKTVSPAVVERVTERIQITPAEVNPDGTIATLPTYRNEDRQVIVVPRKNNWFETPCPDVLTVEFTSSLQRALLARGVYAGPITGVMDTTTGAAIQTLQQQDGLDSSVLALKTARALGLVAIDLSTLE